MADLVTVDVLKDKILSPFCSAIVLAFIPGPAPHGHNVAAVAPSFSFSENTTPGQEERTALCLLLGGRKPFQESLSRLSFMPQSQSLWSQANYYRNS